MAPTEVNVRVAVRCRPLIGMGEQLEGPADFIKCMTEAKQVIVDDKVFTFDYVFDTTHRQNEIYATSVTPIVENFLHGSNAAVIAYGQTGSGKTFTMGTMEEFGQSDANSTAIENAPDVGIIPRVLKHIFQHVENREHDEENCDGTGDDSPSIAVSFLEVYNEDVYDILNPSRPKIPIRENAHVIKLPELKEVVVTSYEEAMRCLSDGAQIRTTGATATNAHSSRSHAIFSVQLGHIIGGKYVENRIMLVDLAGSESVKKTKTQGPRFKEGININRGLLALGNVIRALSKDKGRSYVPYRDSTLSRLLQTCLQGNSNTLIIACINPVENNFLETTSTLQFAINARAVKIKLLAADKETGTPCGWRRPYNSFITPSTVGRSRLNKIHNRSAAKMPLNSTMLPSTAIRDIQDQDLSAVYESTPATVRAELRFSPLPTLDESPVEPVFKKPRTPPQIAPRTISGFTPYVERICSSFEKCVGKLLASRPNSRASHFDSPMRNSLVDSIAHQTAVALQDCTNKAERLSEQFTFASLDNSAITASPNLRNKRRASVSSLPEEISPKKSKVVAGNPYRSSAIIQKTDIENRPSTNTTTLQQSVLMSPNRTMESHTANILSVINRANSKQLQLLPHVGAKSAAIIYNWRMQNGPLQNISDIKGIPGLPKSFMKHFARKNVLLDHMEEL